MNFLKLGGILLFATLLTFKQGVYAMEDQDDQKLSEQSPSKKTSTTKDHDGFKWKEGEEKPAELWEVAKFFIHLEKKRRREMKEAPPLDRWKIQKLCYYAQGYYLAMFGQPLFEEDLIAYFYGPYSADLNDKCNEVYNKRNLNQHKLELFEPTISLTIRQMEHSQLIFRMKFLKSGKDLVEESHFEDPWMNESRGFVIGKDKLKDFFDKEEQKNQYVKLQITSASPTNPPQQPNDLKPKAIEGMAPKDVVECLLRSMEEYKKKNTPKELKNIKKIINHIRKLAEAKNSKEIDSLYCFLAWVENFDDMLVSLKDQLKDQPWPHQNRRESFLGQLFFPQELIDLYEPALDLYGRGHILTKLAYAARHGHPLAYYHLSSAFELYSEDESEDEGSEPNKEGPILTKRPDDEGKVNKIREISQKLKGKRNEILKNIQECEEYPCFELGQLYFFLDQNGEALEWFRKGDKAGDVRATYHLAAYEEEGSAEQKQFYQRAKDNGYLRALLDLAYLDDEHEQSYEFYQNIGDDGIPEGYYRAAIMIRRGYTPLRKKESKKVAAELFEKAGGKGIVGAYAKAASLFLSLDAPQKAIEMYEHQGEQGDSKGYKSLIDYYNEQNMPEKVNSFLLKMEGPFSFSYNSNLEKENVIQLLNRYFESLYQIVIGE